MKKTIFSPFGKKNNVTGNYLSDEFFTFNIPLRTAEEEEQIRLKEAKEMEDRRTREEKAKTMFLGMTDEKIGFPCFLISYYYLATGMEGMADTRPEEVVCAESRDRAIYDYNVKHFTYVDPGTFEEFMAQKEYMRTWGLSVKPI